MILSASIASLYVVVGTFDSLVTFLGVIPISTSQSPIEIINATQVSQNTRSFYLLSLGSSYSVVGGRFLINETGHGSSIPLCFAPSVPS